MQHSFDDRDAILLQGIGDINNTKPGQPLHRTKPGYGSTRLSPTHTRNGRTALVFDAGAKWF